MTKPDHRVQRIEHVPLAKLRAEPEQAALVCEVVPARLRRLIAEMTRDGLSDFDALLMVLGAAANVAFGQQYMPGCFAEAAELFMSATAKEMRLPWPPEYTDGDAWPEATDEADSKRALMLLDFVDDMRAVMGPRDVFDTLMAQAGDMAFALNLGPDHLEALGREYMLAQAQSAMNESKN